jgi:hypothetical protein
MADIPEILVEELAASAADRMPLLLDRLPRRPAAQVGRLGAPEEADTTSRWARLRQHRGQWASPVRAPRQPAVMAALDQLGSLLAERLFGALELSVGRMDPTDAPSLAAYLPPAITGGTVAVLSVVEERSDAVTAVTLLEHLSPGVADLVVELVRRLKNHSTIVPLLAVASDAPDEGVIAAQHGARYLALAVATASSVIPRQPGIIDRAAAIVGVGLGTAAIVLPEAPMPPTYPAALLAKLRAEYILPRHFSGWVPVSGHQFALLDGATFPEHVDFTGNGLVTVVDGGAVVRTGAAEGHLQLQLSVLAEAPPEAESGWDEVVEVSWRAAGGRTSMVGPDGPGDPRLRGQTPPWPGDYRLRVHARGRDEQELGSETYRLVIWAAPAAPPIAHRHTDRLGHHLRGEPEPPRPLRRFRMSGQPDRTPYSVEIAVSDWLIVDGTMDNEVSSEAENGDLRQIVELGSSIRQAGWSTIPDWPKDVAGFQNWPAPGQTATMILTGDQWALIHSALTHWALVSDRVGHADDAERSRAIAALIDRQLTEQGWTPEG